MIKSLDFKKLTTLSDEKLILALFISIFLPFYLTAAVLLIAIIYIIKQRKLSDVFEKNGNAWAMAFTIYTFAVGLLNLNFVGAACSIGFIALMLVGAFTRKFITPNIFEKGLNLTCLCGVITTVICLLDFLYNELILNHPGVYRCTLYFLNSNYLATIFATVIIVCGYKVLYHKGRAITYYSTALICAVGAYLTGSMFVWVEVFIGCAALLAFTRRHQMLSALFLLAGTGIIVLYCMPGLLPRIQDSNITTDNRVIIWTVTLKAIKAATPFFGQGFLTYFHIQGNYPESYPTAHSHSIFLEPIASFGIIGTVLIAVFFIYYYKKVITCRNAQNKFGMSALILAITCAILVHATTDLTFMWIQTGLFYCLIMSGIGIEEKLLKIE